MAFAFDPPRISAKALSLETHVVNVLDATGQSMMNPPSGGLVLEVWAAHVPVGASVERAYINYGWMKPSTAIPVSVHVAAVTGHDPTRPGAIRWNIFYKARWVRGGNPASPWSNVAVVDQPAQPAAGAIGVPGMQRRWL
ncbi:MAG: hypothetical protein QM783_05730 [Phycisphaerales bacterium]